MVSDRSQQVSVERTVSATAEAIFEVLRDPTRHSEFDGSGSVVAATGEQTRLGLGSTFGIRMRMGVPYRIRNRVIELEENRLIAWAHFPGHRWRYELEPISTSPDDPSTLVRETFDWSTAKFGWVLELMGFPRRHRPAMAVSLVRLARLVEGAE